MTEPKSDGSRQALYPGALREGEGQVRRGEDHPGSKIRAWEARWIYYLYHVEGLGVNWISSVVPCDVRASAVASIVRDEAWETITRDLPTRTDLEGRQG